MDHRCSAAGQTARPAGGEHCAWALIRPFSTSPQAKALIVRSRIRKRFDTAQMPYERLLASGTLSEAARRELASVYRRLNAVRLRAEIDASLEDLWSSATPLEVT